MSDFKGGGIKTTDYDSYNTKYITQKTEFIDDVYVFGKLYADLGGDVQTFSTAGVERVRIDKEGKVTIKSGDLFIEGNQAIDINNSALELRGNNGGNGFITNAVGDLNISNIDTGKSLNLYSAHEVAIYTNVNAIRFSVDEGGQVVFKPMTQTARDALNPEKGGVIFNETTNKLQCWNGSSWNNLF